MRSDVPNKSGFHHAKSLGQNFLTDAEIVRSIVEGSGIDKDTLVVEIGPGEGALTDSLAEAAGAVLAIELDDRLIPILNTRFALQDHVEIVHGDILKVDLPALTEEKKRKHGLSRLRVVGNLPYYITTPIIMRLLESDLEAESMTVMMQKEVGDRLLAEPGTKLAGAITYAVHYYSRVSKICDVSRESFYPVPKVDSVVLRLDVRNEPPVKVQNEAMFFRCIKAGFSLRRKTLLNSLSALEDCTREQLTAALAEADIQPQRRAETLSMEEFAGLSNILWEG